MGSSTKSAPKFRVGDWVSLLYGPQRVLAEVVEDRGPLGVRGGRLYRIRPNLDHEESATFEVPEDDLEAARSPEAANPLLKVALEFLSHGKQFTGISPEKLPRTKRNVTFHFSDGTEEVRTFECDHATFMRWWKGTADYLRGIADAFGAPD